MSFGTVQVQASVRRWREHGVDGHRSPPRCSTTAWTSPPELHDPDAAVWHDQRAYHRYVTAHGWTLPPADRMGCTTTPANCRSAAAGKWAVETGAFTTTTYGDGRHPHTDWNALRAAGLCE